MTLMLTLQQFITSVILGAVQGVSEWLPISSKTQVIVTSTYLLNLTFQQAYTFGLFMEIGSVLAAIIYFRREMYTLVEVLLGSREAHKVALFKYVLIVTVFTGLIGAPLYLFADSFSSIPVGLPLLIIGMVLIADALLIRHARKKQGQGVNTRKFENLSLKEYITIGIAQGIAALPGVSRSGITTSTLLLMKVEANEAFRLSFLVGIFAALSAFGLTLVATHSNVSVALSAIGYLGLGVAIITATAVSLLLIDILLKIAKKSSIVYLTAALGMIAICSGLLYFALAVPAVAG